MGVPAELVDQALSYALQSSSLIHTNLLDYSLSPPSSHASSRSLTLGLEGIDDLSDIHYGSITELIGPSSSGKTQLCLQSAYLCSFLSPRTRVFVCDSGLAVEAGRLKEMMGEKIRDNESIYGNGNGIEYIENALDRITIARTPTVHDLLSVVHQFAPHAEDAPAPTLLIIDSVAPLFSVLLSESKRGHALVSLTMRAIKRIAYENNMAVIVTNYTVNAGPQGHGHGHGGMGAAASGGEATKPALGESWGVYCDKRIRLDPEDLITHTGQANGQSTTEKRVRIRVIKNHRGPSGQTALLRIGKAGLRVVQQ